MINIDCLFCFLLLMVWLIVIIVVISIVVIFVVVVVVIVQCIQFVFCCFCCRYCCHRVHIIDSTLTGKQAELQETTKSPAITPWIFLWQAQASRHPGKQAGRCPEVIQASRLSVSQQKWTLELKTPYKQITTLLFIRSNNSSIVTCNQPKVDHYQLIEQMKRQ